MIKIRIFSRYILLSVVLSGIISLSGCKKDDEEVAPTLPPQSAFVMNFDDFSSAGDTLKSGLQTETYNNWGYAFVNVAVWNSVLTATLAIPVASYIEALNHEAIYHPDGGNWTWSYNFNVGMTAYEAELTGSIESENAVWEMRITKAGAYSDYLWYRGKSSLDLTSGYWILTESPLNPVDVLRIDWKKYDDGTSDIRYSIIKTGDPEEGSYIWYGTALTTLDRFYQIYRKTTENHTSVEWSSTLKNGRIKDPLHFNDTSWHCWDINLQDVVCP